MLADNKDFSNSLQELRVKWWIQKRKPGLEIAIHSSMASTLPSCHGLSHHAVGSPTMPWALPSCHSTATRAGETPPVFSTSPLSSCFLHTFSMNSSISLWVSSSGTTYNFQTDLSKTLLNDKQIFSFALRGITTSNSSLFFFFVQ